MTDAAAVRLHGISKRFGAVVANDGVDLTLARGSVHAVMGENGAGKSTLMSILYGMVQPDAGRIEVDGAEVRLRSPLDAVRHGLGMVHQHFQLFDSLTVAENVVLGAEPRAGLRIDRAAADTRVEELCTQYGFGVDARARVGDLSVGQQQSVELLKTLHRATDVLILDEPTAVLTPGEVDSLFTIVRATAERGTSVVLVTHKVREVLEVADEVTVLRDGRVTGRFDRPDADAGSLVTAMTGRTVAPARNTGSTPGRPVLEVSGLTVRAGGVTRVRDVDLTVHAGEVVGVAGVSGNGQHDLVAAVLGTTRDGVEGSVRVDGVDVTHQPVRRRRDAGLAVVAEDRRAEGLATTASVADNLAAGHHRQPPLAPRRGWVSRRAVRTFARDLIGAYGIRAGSELEPAGSLSGGNAQRVVLARELAHGSPVLVVEQPTQGVDVGAIEEIHRRLLDHRKRGGVLLVSHEISELLALADRILVMYEGVVVDEMDRSEATESRIGAAMAGAPA